MPFLAPSLNNADPLFVLVIIPLVSALVITPGIYVCHVEVEDQDPASGSLYENLLNGATCRLM